MSVNKVILVGTLGQDPEVRYTQNQTAIATLSVATNERRKGADGEWAEHTEWHRVVTFGKTAESAGQYLAKGRQVYVEGSIRTRKWQDKEGKDRYSTDVVASVLQFLGKRDREEPTERREKEDRPSVRRSAPPVEFEDSDIPF